MYDILGIHIAIQTKGGGSMKKWVGLSAMFALMIGMLYFLWIRPGIFFAVSISDSLMFHLKVVAVIAVLFVILVTGILLLRKYKKQGVSDNPKIHGYKID